MHMDAFNVARWVLSPARAKKTGAKIVARKVFIEVKAAKNSNGHAGWNPGSPSHEGQNLSPACRVEVFQPGDRMLIVLTILAAACLLTQPFPEGAGLQSPGLSADDKPEQQPSTYG